MTKYSIVYWFEYGGPCLWSRNEEAKLKFGYNINKPELLSLSKETVQKIHQLEKWFQTSLDWQSPTNHTPWSQAECDKFNQASVELFEQIKSELNGAFLIENKQSNITINK